MHLLNQSRFQVAVAAFLLFGICGGSSNVKAACGSPGFGAPAAFNVRLRGVAVADFNGDGRRDVIAAGDFSSFVHLMINNGAQGFLPPVTFSTGGWPGAIAVGDFNNDQKADVVTSNFNPAGVSILLGNGSGSFAAPMNIPLGTGTALAVGEFNGDQNLDLAVSDSGGAVAILLGTGSGTFTGPTSFSVGGVRSIAVADFNIDGNNDLAIVGQFSGEVSVLFGNGSGSFGTPATFNSGSEPSAIVAQDFNNDGKPDLAIALIVNMVVLINNGAGTFSAPGILSVAGSNPAAIVTADFNNDGQYDLAVGHNTGVSVRFGNGSGNFGNQTNFPLGLGPTFLGAGDLNDDGSVDLVVSSYSGSVVSFLLNDEIGGFKIAPTFSNNPDANSVVAGDFNNDGKTDLAVANRNGNSVSIHPGDGLGTFGAARVFSVGDPPSTNVTNGPFSLAVADFNGDSRLDLVTANFTGGNVTILSGDGAGNFSSQKIAVTGGSSPQYVVTGDFNLDAKADVALTRNGVFSKVTILFGNGNGGFSSQTDFDTGIVTSESLTAGDLNADSKLDVVVGSPSGGEFSVLLNDGSGGFSAPTLYTLNTNTGQSSVATIGDFTGDGKVDLVVTNYMRDKLALLPGNGLGVFSSPTFFNVGENPHRLAQGDFNGDGLLDVATAYVTSAAISVLLNNGASGFLAPKNFLGASPHESVAVADFNGDSLPDLATESISVFLNSCTSTSAPSLPTLTITNVSVGESPTSALFEIALSSASSQTVSVRYQTSGQSAVTGADFRLTTGTLNFAPGETFKTIAVPILDDSFNEFTETFSLNLHHPVNAAIKKGQGTGSILDSDPIPTLTLNNVAVVEGDSGTAPANFGVALSSPSGKLIQLTYSTADVSATAGSDYQGVSSVVLNISAGSPSASIPILVNGDTAIEPDETFSLNVSNPLNATISGTSATGTIVDDETVKLLLDASGPGPNQATAFDALLFVRDPFRVVSIAEWWNFGSDRNTRVALFTAGFTLNPGETASDVTVNLVDTNSQSRDIAAEDVRAVPNSNFTQVTFRLPDGLLAGNCQIRVKVHGQTSNAGTIRIVP